MKLSNIFIGLLLGLFVQCSGVKKTVEAPVEIKEEFLDTLVVTAPPFDPAVEKPQMETKADIPNSLPLYQPSYHRKHDLLHTKLNLSFDWQNQTVIGQAELSLKPLFYSSNELELDAINFDIKSIKLNGVELAYEYDKEKIHITLDRNYDADDTYVLSIDYLAHPNDGEAGGSAAITSEKGLFFINPLGTEDKPMQIWTQGETENNSRWFPTIDKPIERCTQEIILTVEDRFKTLSNGIKISSKKNTDGTRTDHWKLDKPHAPYLFMIAVGEFAVVKDQWKDIDVDYYVEPDYEDHARQIFNHTPEMIDFFSSRLDVAFPWPSYAQIVVRDYVSGAMENTTAVIYGDFVQKTTEELVDNTNDFIVAHELIHHWFGDLVTCESWSNLTMNEGFANYGEYLWFEFKYGSDAADFHRQNELAGYLGDVGSGNIHPLIHFSVEDKEQMFDGHSYNKGGLVLHMLRSYVGDDAFYASLKKYLTDNAYQAVEAHHLRLAFEEVTGEDLNWFFNQWYFSQGHPIIDVEGTYQDGEYLLTLSQIQDPTIHRAIFELPTTIELQYADGRSERSSIRINQRKQSFAIAASEQPINVVIDPTDDLLCIFNESKSEEAYAHQYKNTSDYLHRFKALQHFANASPGAAIFKEALKDPHWSLRTMAINLIKPSIDNLTLLNQAVNSDPHSGVRTAALQVISQIDSDQSIDILKGAYRTEKLSAVRAAALKSLALLDQEYALIEASKIQPQKGPLLDAVAAVYAASGDSAYLDFFREKINSLGGFDIMTILNHYTHLLQSVELSVLAKHVDLLEQSASGASSIFKRYGSTKALSDLKVFLGEYRESSELSDDDRKYASELTTKIKQYINAIKAKESDPQLKNAYMFLD